MINNSNYLVGEVMISLEEYKEYLINYYRYEIDNNVSGRGRRRKELSRKYGDELLEKIINDTYDFIRDVFSSDTIKFGYCKFDLDMDTTSYISLNICGGGFADISFIDNKGRIISKYILGRIFGNQFMIYVKEDVEHRSEDDFVFGIDANYFLYMQGFPENMSDLEKELFGKNKQLVKTDIN